MKNASANEKEKIHAKVIEIVREVLSLDADDPPIAGTTRFVDDLGAESLDMAQFVMALEEEFQESIADEKIMGLETIEDAVDFIYAEFAKSDG